MTTGPAGKPSSAGLGTFSLLWPHALPSLFLWAGVHRPPRALGPTDARWGRDQQRSWTGAADEAVTPQPCSRRPHGSAPPKRNCLVLALPGLCGCVRAFSS